MKTTTGAGALLKTIISFLLLWHFAGCTTQDIFIQNLQVYGPINQSPIHHTDGDFTKRFHLLGGISVPQKTNQLGRIDKHTYVNSSGQTQFDTMTNGSVVSYEYHASNNQFQYSGNNLDWDTPASNYALELSYLLSEHVIFDAGINYSRIRQSDFLSQHVGLGFSTYDENVALRADIGAHFSQVSYTLSYVVLSYSGDINQSNPSVADVRFGELNGKNNNVDIYYGLTFNTKRNDWPLNLFVKGAIDKEELIDYDVPSFFSYARPNASYTATLFSLTPGVSVLINPSVRINAGVGFIWNLSLLNEEKQAYMLPLIQFDWSL
jgi:hypothetical protein